MPTRPAVPTARRFAPDRHRTRAQFVAIARALAAAKVARLRHELDVAIAADAALRGASAPQRPSPEDPPPAAPGGAVVVDLAAWAARRAA